MSSFWDCDRLFFEDLPTVRDLIWNADWDILVKEVVAIEGEWREEAIRGALGDMMKLEAREPSPKWVFMPLDYYSTDSADEGLIQWHIDAALLRQRDLPAIDELSGREKPQCDIGGCRKAMARDSKRLGEKYPDLYSWELEPWEKVLSFRAWMHGGYSRKERYQVIACIVSEMMRFGDTRDEAREEQRTMKRRLKRSSKALETGKAKSNPIELLMRDYGLESSTDDYDDEFNQRVEDAVTVMNYNAGVDLHRRVSDLVKRARRAEKRNFHTQP